MRTWRAGVAGVWCGWVVATWGAVSVERMVAWSIGETCGVRLQPHREGEIDLRPRFARGQTIRYTLEVEAISRESTRPGLRQGGDVDNEQRTWVRLDLVLKVREAEPGQGSEIEMGIERVRVRSDGAGGRIGFDSARKPAGGGDEEGMLESALRKVTDSPLVLKLDGVGNVVSVTGGEGLAALAGLVGSMPRDASAGVFSNVVPARKATGVARVGESWTNEDVIDSPLLGRVRLRTTHRLARVDGEAAEIELSGTGVGADEGEWRMRTPLGLEISGLRQQGRYAWGTREGALRRLETSMTCQVRGEIMGESIASYVESRVRISRADMGMSLPEGRQDGRRPDR